MSSPVSLQTLSAAPVTVWAWWIATLPVSTNSTNQRGRKTNTRWRVTTHRMGKKKQKTDWCDVIQETQTKSLVLVVFKSNTSQKCTFFSTSNISQEKEALEATEVKKLRAERAGAARGRRNYTTWDHKDLQGEGKRNCWSQDVCSSLLYSTGPALHCRKGFRGKSRKKAEQQGATGEPGLIYLSSSGATCSTKILGLGGVLWGKEMGHLERQEVGRRSIHGQEHQKRMLVSRGMVEAQNDAFYVRITVQFLKFQLKHKKFTQVVSRPRTLSLLSFLQFPALPTFPCPPFLFKLKHKSPGI